jgi:hypothetical protein
MSLRPALMFACVTALTGAFVACSARESGEAGERSASVGKASSAIKGGTDTTLYPFVVGVQTANGGTCTGTLIAPNLVLTARHCVSSINTGEQIDCTTSTFTGNYPATGFAVTTSPVMTRTARYYGVTKVIVPSVTKVCGNDMALLQLNAKVPASEAPSIAPLIGHTLYNQKLFSDMFVAVGYGLTGTQQAAPNSSGTRRIRTDMRLQCLPGRPDSECNFGNYVFNPNDVLTGNGVCQGDSGSAMLERRNFDNGVYLATGVLSRGGPDCTDGIYTRTDAWKDWLVSNGIAAATAGGYAPLAWMTPPAADPEDAPVPKATRDAGADTGKPVPPKPKKAFGEACDAPAECAGNACTETGAAGETTCSQTCDEANVCPDGYACNEASICAIPPPPVTPPAANANATGGGGCSVTGDVGRTDPTKPIPWRSAGLALGCIAGVCTAMRRKRRIG